MKLSIVGRLSLTVLLPVALMSGSLQSVAAAPHSGTIWSLESGPTRVLSSSGRNLWLQIRAVRQEGTTIAPFVVTLLDAPKARSVYGESHEWTFLAKPTILRMATKSADLRMGSQMTPFGTVNLKFSGAHTRHSQCSAGSQTVVTGTLTGSFRFRTGSKSWGMVSLKRLNLSPSSLTTNEGCALRTVKQPKCVSGVSWQSGNQTIKDHGKSIGSENLYGGTIHALNGRSIEAISAFRQVTLSRPKSASRQDSALIPAKPPKRLHATIAVSAPNKGLISGKAVLRLTGKPASARTPDCLWHGKKHKQHVVRYTHVHWTNAKPGLVANLAVGGEIKIRAGKSGEFDRDFYR